MVWGITGYTAGGRMPLNNALRAGQFRTGTVNFFQRPINIQNNFYGGMGIGVGMYAPYDDGGTSSTMKWATGLAIGGGVLSALGNIFGAIWGGNKSEGAGGASKVEETNQEDPDTSAVAALRDAYKKQCTISDKTSLGYVISDLKTPGKVDFAKDLNELKAKLAQLYPASEEKAKVDDEPKVVQPKVEEQPKAVKSNNEQISSKEDFGKLFSSDFVNKNYVDGKGLTINGQTYKTPEEAYKAMTGGNTAVATNNALDLSSIAGNITDVIDYSETVSDWKSIKASKSYNSADNTLTIGNNKYIVNKDNNGYVTLTLLKSASFGQRTLANREQQVYILEQTADGKYQLAQRKELLHAGIGEGYNKGIGSM